MSVLRSAAHYGDTIAERRGTIMPRSVSACLLFALLAGCTQPDLPATTPILREAGLTAAEESSIRESLAEALKGIEADIIRCESNGARSSKRVRLVLLRRPVKGARPETPAEAAVREEINEQAGVVAPTRAIDYVVTFEGQRVISFTWNHKGAQWREASAEPRP
jgi:hypothetical protein